MGRFCISQISNINKQELKTLISSDKTKCSVFKFVIASFPLRFWLFAVGYECYGREYWNSGKLLGN